MNGNKSNYLTIIERGKIFDICLDDKAEWKIGRPNHENMPDIVLKPLTISRFHGMFKNFDGTWFYYDNYSKNGTTYNGKYLKVNKNGIPKPELVDKGGIFVFGGGDKAIICNETVWARFAVYEKCPDWRVEDTYNMGLLHFSDEVSEMEFKEPEKGTVVETDRGIAIYMGDVTYTSGRMEVNGWKARGNR